MERKIGFWGDQYTIEGVTENFHQQSLPQKEAYARASADFKIDS